jgi:hypothetical protein
MYYCSSVIKIVQIQIQEKPQVPTEEVERRLVNEAIDEVVGIENGQPNDDLCYSWVDEDLEERMRRNNLWVWSENPKRPSTSIADRVQSAKALSPSLNRDQLEDQGINLVESHQSDINQIFQTDDLPEATNEVLAGLGIFETSIGRRLFNKINGIETPQLRRGDVSKVMQVEAQASVSTPSPAVVPEAPRRSSDIVLGDIGNEIDQMAKKAAERMKNAPKLRRPKRQPAVAEPIGIEQCRKTLKNFKFKALGLRDIVMLMHAEVNFDHSHYQDDKLGKEKPRAMTGESLAEIIGLETQLEAVMISPVRDLLTSTPLALDNNIVLNHNTPVNSLDLLASKVPQAKRPRIGQSANFEIPKIVVVPPAEELVQPQVTSHNKNQPVIDATDMEFASLQHESLSRQPITLEGTPKDDRPSRKIRNEDEFDEDGRHLFRRVKGKYDTMIEFVGSDGKIKSRSNYSMEVSWNFQQK